MSTKRTSSCPSFSRTASNLPQRYLATQIDKKDLFAFEIWFALLVSIACATAWRPWTPTSAGHGWSQDAYDRSRQGKGIWEGVEGPQFEGEALALQEKSRSPYAACHCFGKWFHTYLNPTQNRWTQPPSPERNSELANWALSFKKHILEMNRATSEHLNEEETLYPPSMAASMVEKTWIDVRIICTFHPHNYCESMQVSVSPICLILVSFTNSLSRQFTSHHHYPLPAVHSPTWQLASRFGVGRRPTLIGSNAFPCPSGAVPSLNMCRRPCLTRIWCSFLPSGWCSKSIGSQSIWTSPDHSLMGLHRTLLRALRARQENVA